MVVFWFLLALVLLVAALVLLRLDSRRRGSGRETRPAVGVGPSGEKNGTGGDDEAPPVAAPGDEVDDSPGAQPQEPGTPQLAPFQRAAVSAEPQTDAGGHDARLAAEVVGDPGPVDEVEVDPAALDSAAVDPAAVDPVVDDVATADSAAAIEPAALDRVAVDRVPVDRGAVDPVAVDPAEPTAESSPRLLDRVRAFLPARRQTGRLPEPSTAAPADPLAGSPVVRWLEDRDFEPTPTPAPEFRHGDFAGGLSALGTVSHGMFRGRRAIMGVTGGRTVLALRRDTASDVVLDLSRPDVDAEPGFHDAGEVAALEARTSDFGRLDLIDRDRLADAVREVPADVRRVWAEGEWLASTVDGVDNPSTWDDVVMALHAAADVLAPFPPIGGRARALPAEIDPGSPGAVAGPEADPTVGMDGEVGTGTSSAGPSARTAPRREGRGQDAPDHDARDPEAPHHDAPRHDTPTHVDLDSDSASPGPADSSAPAPESRRAGHLRLVPDRTGARDLSDVPVVADRGDQTGAPATEDPATDDPATDEAPLIAEPTAAEPTAAEPTVEEPAVEEPDPFGDIMEPTGPVPARGDVAADHLASRPPLSRPTRGAGHAYPEDASVPPLAAGVTTGAAGIKPLGSEDDEDEIRSEVERFDAARTDGGSDLDTGSGGRHSQPASEEEIPVWLRPDVTPEPPRAGSGRHRRAAEDPVQALPTDTAEPDTEPETAEPDTAEPDATGADAGQERPGAEPDVEQTARLQLPPDIRD